MLHWPLHRCQHQCRSRLVVPERASPQLRWRPPPEERSVRQEVRGHRLGVHFTRQSLLPPCIVNFDCPQGRLVVELDGSPQPQQPGCEQLRDTGLAGLGTGMLLVANHAVRDDPPAVIHLRRKALRHLP